MTSEGLTQLHADTVQVVHDLAPTAALAFAMANGGDDAFANNLRALAAAGAKIVDDVGYFDEPFWDGPEALAVNGVTAAGVTHFGSAGNANVIGGGRNIFIVGDA